MQMLHSDVPDTREDMRRASSDQTPETRGPASLPRKTWGTEEIWTTQAQPHFHSTPCFLKQLHSVSWVTCCMHLLQLRTRNTLFIAVDVRRLSNSTDDPKRSSSRASSGQRNPWPIWIKLLRSRVSQTHSSLSALFSSALLLKSLMGFSANILYICKPKTCFCKIKKANRMRFLPSRSLWTWAWNSVYIIKNISIESEMSTFT